MSFSGCIFIIRTASSRYFAIQGEKGIHLRGWMNNYWSSIGDLSGLSIIQSAPFRPDLKYSFYWLSLFGSKNKLERLVLSKVKAWRSEFDILPGYICPPGCVVDKSIFKKSTEDKEDTHPGPHVDGFRVGHRGQWVLDAGLVGQGLWLLISDDEKQFFCKICFFFHWSQLSDVIADAWDEKQISLQNVQTWVVDIANKVVTPRATLAGTCTIWGFAQNWKSWHIFWNKSWCAQVWEASFSHRFVVKPERHPANRDGHDAGNIHLGGKYAIDTGNIHLDIWIYLDIWRSEQWYKMRSWRNIMNI